MTYGDVVAYFKRPADAARALGLDRRSVDAWKRRRIPSVHQLAAEHLSGGKLVADDEAREEGRRIASYVKAA